MGQIIRVRPGEVFTQDGSYPEWRGGRTGEGLVAQAKGLLYEQTYRGRVFSDGMTVTALTANTISLTATTTPILGVWNPPNSPVVLSILRAHLQLVTPASCASMGVLVWAVSNGNNAITTGKVPWNRKTLTQAGSAAKGVSFTALTGLTNNLVIMSGSSLPSITTAQGATVTPLYPAGGVEYFDGGLHVPPGAVLALLNTTSNTTVSVAGTLVWEEVPV